MYTNIGSRPLENASTVLACIAFVVTTPIYFFYRKGPAIRERSKFASQIMEDTKRKREEREAKEAGTAATPARNADPLAEQRRDEEAAYL